MSKTVLITGANGFVGKQVLNALLKTDTKIRLVLRPEKQEYFKNINQIEKIIISSNLFNESADWWKESCIGVDTVIHIAWYSEPGKYLMSELNLDCLIGTLQLAKGAIQAQVRRFIGIGTCFEYDFEEGYLSINTKLNPSTPYASAKAASYIALSQCLANHGIEFAWCRLFYLYGAGEDERRLIPYLHKQLSAGNHAELTTGEQLRDFIDVEEAGNLIAKTALGNQIGPINICSGKSISIRQIAENIADIHGRRDLLIFGARTSNITDPNCVVGIPNHEY